jgi:hypothetical protein
MRPERFCILLLSVSCLAAFPALGQQDTPTRPDKVQPGQSKSSTRGTKEKPALAEATRASTANAARTAAAVAAQRHGSDPASPPSGVSDVLEFRAASPDVQDSVAAASTKDSKKSALKSVHGDAYGVMDSRGAGKQAGGAVGATSKGGKTSIYVETDRAHDTAPAPH